MDSKCPEALMHTKDEATGRCLWCKKYMDRACNPRPAPQRIKSNSELAYEYYFNPDFGLDKHDIYSGDA